MAHKAKKKVPLCVTCINRGKCKDPCNPSRCEFHQMDDHAEADPENDLVFQQAIWNADKLYF